MQGVANAHFEVDDDRAGAEAVVVEGWGEPFERIASASGGSSVVLMGMRSPRPDETAESYAAYFDSLMHGTETLPQAVFMRAAEPLHFKNLFGA